MTRFTTRRHGFYRWSRPARRHVDPSSPPRGTQEPFLFVGTVREHRLRPAPSPTTRLGGRTAWDWSSCLNARPPVSQRGPRAGPVGRRGAAFIALARGFHGRPPGARSMRRPPTLTFSRRPRSRPPWTSSFRAVPPSDRSPLEHGDAGGSHRRDRGRGAERAAVTTSSFASAATMPDVPDMDEPHQGQAA